MKRLLLLALAAAFAVSATAQEAPKKPALRSADEILLKWDPPTNRSGQPAPVKVVNRSATVPSTIIENYRKMTEAVSRGGGADRFRGITVVPKAKETEPTITVPVDGESGISFDNILFKLDSDELLDDNSRQQVKVIAEVMAKKPALAFLVEGHTCDLGEEAHNKSLSEKRASRIVEELKKLGVGPERLLPMGYGESSPTVSNDSDANRQKNRRVTIYKRA